MYFLYITFYTIYTYTSYIFLAENSSVIVALNAEKMGWWAVQHNGEGHGLRWAEWELGREGLQFQFRRRHLITREEQTAGGIQENSWHQDAQPEETGERTGYTPGRTVRNTEHRSKELGHIAWPVWILGLGWILTTGWENLQSRQADGAGFEYDRAKVRDVSLNRQSAWLARRQLWVISQHCRNLVMWHKPVLPALRWEHEVRSSRPSSASVFQASLEYMRPCLKIK